MATASLKALAVFAVVVVVVVVPRLAALPRPVDLAVGLTWTAAGWANVMDWYVTNPWVDMPVHATTPGATAAAVYLLLARTDLATDLQDDDVRRSAGVVLTTAVGTTLAVWWEFYEWIVYRDEGQPQVGYDDTLLDLLLGTVSSAVAGLAPSPNPRLTRRRPGSAPRSRRSRCGSSASRRTGRRWSTSPRRSPRCRAAASWIRVLLDGRPVALPTDIGLTERPVRRSDFRSVAPEP